MKKSLWSLFCMLFAASANAAVLNVTDMTVSAGTFSLNNNSPVVNWVNTGNPGANLVGGYVDLGVVGTWFDAPFSVLTQDGSLFCCYPVSNPVVTATIDDMAGTTGTISADLSSWSFYWNGEYFYQGAANVTGTWDELTGVYNLSWSSMIIGGSLNYYTGNWTITGNASAVPVPAAAWMFVSGLMALFAVVRGRRWQDSVA